MRFREDYPATAPACQFSPAIFHPNVFQSGNIGLSLLDENMHWHPSLTTKQVLVGIQTLLDSPNAEDPAQEEAAKLYIDDRQVDVYKYLWIFLFRKWRF
jgi:ubiquitin-conjugating enzyme E2 I